MFKQTFYEKHAPQNSVIKFRHAYCSDCSWFPGYAWTLMYCKTCEDAHIGWRFTAVDEDMVPAVFWALRLPSLASTSWDVSLSGDAIAMHVD